MISQLHQETGVLIKLWSIGLVGFYYDQNQISETAPFADMVSTQDVSDWSQTFHEIDVPNIMFSFSGILSHIIMLDYGYNTTVEIAVPLMGNCLIEKTFSKIIF